MIYRRATRRAWREAAAAPTHRPAGWPCTNSRWRRSGQPAGGAGGPHPRTQAEPPPAGKRRHKPRVRGRCQSPRVPAPGRARRAARRALYSTARLPVLRPCRPTPGRFSSCSSRAGARRDPPGPGPRSSLRAPLVVGAFWGGYLKPVAVHNGPGNNLAAAEARCRPSTGAGRLAAPGQLPEAAAAPAGGAVVPRRGNRWHGTVRGGVSRGELLSRQWALRAAGGRAAGHRRASQLRPRQRKNGNERMGRHHCCGPHTEARAGRRRLWAAGSHVGAAVHSSSLVRASLATFIAAAVETRALRQRRRTSAPCLRPPALAAAGAQPAGTPGLSAATPARPPFPLLPSFPARYLAWALGVSLRMKSSSLVSVMQRARPPALLSPLCPPGLNELSHEGLQLGKRDVGHDHHVSNVPLARQLPLAHEHLVQRALKDDRGGELVEHDGDAGALHHRLQGGVCRGWGTGSGGRRVGCWGHHRWAGRPAGWAGAGGRHPLAALASWWRQ